jgi:lysophospholipase L1-like esterase
MKSEKTRRFFSACAVLASLALPAGAQDRMFAGRFPSPVLDRTGALAMLYVDTAGALRLGREGSSGEDAVVRIAASGRSPLFPRLREDGTGSLRAVWVENGALTGGVILGHIEDGSVASTETVAESPGTAFSPDLDFDPAGRAWIAWAQQTDKAFEVRVREPGSGGTWRVGPQGLLSVSSVRILAGGPGGTWVFWTGRDLGRDEVFACRFDGSAWSAAVRLNAVNSAPHIFLDAAADSAGRIRVVWSAYEDGGYRVRGVLWNGESWTSEETLTHGRGSDAFPSLASVRDGVPVLVWNRTLGRTSTLCVRSLADGAPAREIRIASVSGAGITEVRTVGRDGRLVVVRQSGGSIRSTGLTLEELEAGGDVSETPASPASDVPDENAYIAFGDDSTYGVIDGSPAPGLGYVPRLLATIESNFGPSVLSNDGVAGESTVNGLGRIEEVLAARGARYVLLMEGTNDVVIPGISTDATSFNLERMIRKCLDAEALPILATIIPRSDNYWDQLFFRKRLYAVNDEISLITANLEIPVIDMFGSFFDYPAEDGGWQSLLSDGVHPNELGYDVMSRAWWNGLKNIPFPPVNATVTRSVERSVLMSRKVNYLTWNHSPKITNPFKFRSYRIYRRDRDDDDAKYELIATLPYSPFHDPQKYNDLAIPDASRFRYVVTLIRIDGVEGPHSDPALESD